MVGAVVALGIAVVQFWRWLRGDDINRSLRVDEVLIQLVPIRTVAQLNVGIQFTLKNDSTAAIGCRISSADVSWPEMSVPTREMVSDFNLSAHQSRLWERALLAIPRNQLPTTIVVDYTVEYGRIGKSPKWQLHGQRSVHSDQVPARSLRLMAESQQETHEKLSWRHRD